MQFSVRDVASLLRVNENQVYRWVHDAGLPADLVNGQYRFNRTEVLEWATLHKVEVSPEFFRSGNGNGGNGTRLFSLESALRGGGVLPCVKGADREAVLRELVQAMPLPASLDRDFLLEVLLSREAAGSTDLGDGIALPHPRYPVVLPVTQPFITLGFLQQAVRYSSATGHPVHTLFALICPTVRLHLELLARLALGLKDPTFRELILRRAPAEDIFQHAHRLDESFHKAGNGGRECA